MSAHAYTPTERRIMEVLSDGMYHTREELHECLNDDLCVLSRIQMHVSNIRKKLNRIGQDIICGLHRGKPHYRLVRMLHSANTGTR